MTGQEYPDEPTFLYRIYVPSLTRQGTPIPDQTRKKYVRAIEKRCCDVNSGSTAIEGLGAWKSPEDEIVREPITVIETYGKMPLSREQLQHLVKVFDQDTFFVTEDGLRRTYSFRASVEDPLEPPVIEMDEESKTIIIPEERPDGQVIYVRHHFDEEELPPEEFPDFPDDDDLWNEAAVAQMEMGSIEMEDE